MKICIVYDSESGHTKELAQAIADGAANVEEAEVFLNHYSQVDVRNLVDMDAIIWGCPGHFGTISSGLKSWIDKLGYLWAKGKLVGKVGAVFCTTATVHGGTEATLLNLMTPMLHHGMIIAGLPANIPENAFYGSYYGVGVTCPVEENETLSPELPSDAVILGNKFGERVANLTKKLVSHEEKELVTSH